MASLRERLAPKQKTQFRSRHSQMVPSLPGISRRRKKTGFRLSKIFISFFIMSCLSWWVLCFFRMVQDAHAPNRNIMYNVDMNANAGANAFPGNGVRKEDNNGRRVWQIKIPGKGNHETSKSHDRDDDDKDRVKNKDGRINNDSRAVANTTGHGRPLTHKGELELISAVNKMLSLHMSRELHNAKVERKRKGIRGWFQRLPDTFPTNLTYAERKELNATISEIIATNKRKIRKKGKRAEPLRAEEKKEIEFDINSVNEHHERKANFDSCRGTFWEEITINIRDEANAKCNINGVSLDQNRFRYLSEEIVRNIKPYFPLMKSENATKRTVLIVPNALCLGLSGNDPSIGHYDDKMHDITLTTHMGVGKYKRFLVLIQRWNGPTSVAVKIRSLNELNDFHDFVSEHLKELNQISFHYYIEYAPDLDTAYPQNILRNIAMTYIKTQYFLVNDVDIFPSPINTHEKLRATILEHTEIQRGLADNILYVIPMFDLTVMVDDNELIANHHSFPETKQDATDMNKTGVIAQHLKVQHPRGHRAVDYEKWFGNTTDVTYPIQHENKFEPYVIGSKSTKHNDGIIPLFYPYYRGYGYDKYSWYAELEFAGFKLEVLRDYFLFHAKHESSYGDMKMKRELLYQNKICSRGFLQGILNNYGLQENQLWDEWIAEVYEY